MSANTHSDHPEDDTDTSVPSGYRKIQTAQGTKIVREGPVSFVRRELSMSPNRQRLWEDHMGTTILPVTRSFADTSVAPESHLDIAEVWQQDAPLIVDIGVGHGEANAPEVLDHMLVAGTVSEVWVFFSDPWPTHRDHKPSRIQKKYGDRVTGGQTLDGVLRTAIGSTHYAHQLLVPLDKHPAFK